MNAGLKAILMFLLNKKYIGGKHFPEDRLFISRTKYLPREEQRVCEKELHDLVKNEFILRVKKRTGKGTEWHLSLNPRRVEELYGMIP